MYFIIRTINVCVYYESIDVIFYSTASYKGYNNNNNNSDNSIGRTHILYYTSLYYHNTIAPSIGLHVRMRLTYSTYAYK